MLDQINANSNYFTLECLAKIKNPTEANVKYSQSTLFGSHEECFPTEEATINHSQTLTQEGLLSHSKKFTSSCATIGLTAGHWLTQVTTRLVGSKAVLRLKTNTNPSQGEGRAARQESTNHRPGTKRSGINPFHFPELLRSMLLTIQIRTEPVFKRILKIQKYLDLKPNEARPLNYHPAIS